MKRLLEEQRSGDPLLEKAASLLEAGRLQGPDLTPRKQAIFQAVMTAAQAAPSWRKVMGRWLAAGVLVAALVTGLRWAVREPSPEVRQPTETAPAPAPMTLPGHGGVEAAPLAPDSGRRPPAVPAPASTRSRRGLQAPKPGPRRREGAQAQPDVDDGAGLVLSAVRHLRVEQAPAAAFAAAEEYLRRYPGGGLEEEAIATSMEALASMGDARAMERASLYLSRFPQGRFAEVARALSRRKGSERGAPVSP